MQQSDAATRIGEVDRLLQRCVRFLPKYVDENILAAARAELARHALATSEEIQAAVDGSAGVEPSRRLTIVYRLGDILHSMCPKDLLVAEMLALIRRILEKGGISPVW